MSENTALGVTRPTTLTLDALTVDTARRTVVLHGAPVVLTWALFAGLAALLEADGAPVSRALLCQAALGRAWVAEDRSIDQLILLLRRQLPGVTIRSVRHVGYWMPRAVGGEAAIERRLPEPDGR